MSLAHQPFPTDRREYSKKSLAEREERITLTRLIRSYSRLGNFWALKNHIRTVKHKLNPFTSYSAKSITDIFSKFTNWLKLKNEQHHNKVLLNRFPMNAVTLVFCP